MFWGFVNQNDVYGQKRPFLALQEHKLLYADTVYNEAVRKSDTLLLAEAYYLYGKTYEAAGDYETCLDFFFKSLYLLEPRGDSPSLSRLYHRLSDMEELSGNYKEMLRLRRQGTTMAERTNSIRNMITGYSSLGRFYAKDWSEKGEKPDLPGSDPDSALYYLEKSIDLAVGSGDSLQMANVLNGTAELFRTFFRKPNIEYANLHRALGIYKSKKREGDQVSALLGLTGHHMALKQYAEALKCLREAETVYLRNPFNDITKQMNIQAYFVEYYSVTGRWKQAFEHSQKLAELQESHSNPQGVYSKLARQHEAEKNRELMKARETELSLRSEALRDYRLFTTTSTVLVLALVVLSFVFYRLYRKNKQISKQNALLLREQSHRVTNGFQAVSSLIKLSSQTLNDFAARELIEETSLRIEAMGVLHRKLYTGAKFTEVLMPDFFSDIAENVLNTFSAQRVMLELEVDRVYLRSDQAIALGLIVNELITNACKYAFPGHPAPTLKVRYEGGGIPGYSNEVKLIVADNGLNRANPVSADTRRTGGFGMELIKMLSREVSAQYSFEYRNGTFFSMTFLPKISKETIFDPIVQ